MKKTKEREIGRGKEGKQKIERHGERVEIIERTHRTQRGR